LKWDRWSASFYLANAFFFGIYLIFFTPHLFFFLLVQLAFKDNNLLNAHNFTSDQWENRRFFQGIIGMQLSKISVGLEILLRMNGKIGFQICYIILDSFVHFGFCPLCSNLLACIR